MGKHTTKQQRHQAKQTASGSAEEISCEPGDDRWAMQLAGTDPLAERLRGRIDGFIEELVQEELEEALQAARYQRSLPDGMERAGYRHGGRARTLSTPLGEATIRVPRARLFEQEGDGTTEWGSKLIRRYKRRTADVDAALVGAYLSGANSRRIRGALKPMLKDAPLSRSAISRLVKELKATFDHWRTQRLEEQRIAFLYLDAIEVKVRCGGRVERMPVLVALGVSDEGEKEVLGLRLVGSESRNAWALMVEDLDARGLQPPVLCTIDGAKGLRAAIRKTWPGVKIQRCVVHKLRNLEAHCPNRLLPELRSDFHAVSEATSKKAAEKAYQRFIRLWKPRCEAVVESFVEGGDELLTHYAFPKSQWKCLRTTNCIERLNGELRRRIKTQSSLPSESSVLLLFFGIIDSGQMHMRRIDGWRDIPKAIREHATVQAQDGLQRTG